MAKFGLKMDQDGTIYAGTIDKNGKMNNKGEVTMQALEAVRDHFLVKAKNDNCDGYRWPLSNGKILTLKISVEEPEEEKEENNERIS